MKRGVIIGKSTSRKSGIRPVTQRHRGAINWWVVLALMGLWILTVAVTTEVLRWHW